jgi:hypothetical protein
MDNSNFSIGTYSISSDGVSINYSAPSLLPKETLAKIITDSDEVIEEQEKKNTSPIDEVLNDIVKPKG